MFADRMSLTRRRFLNNFAFASGAIATGVGSWVVRPDWANAAEAAIKVGIATDLTGPIAYAGNADANVAKMVIKQINDAGGLLGRPLELYIEDTASNESVAVGNVRKLIHLRADDPGTLPGDDPNDFFTSWLEHGTGGTCWAGNGGLHALLTSLGYNASRGRQLRRAGHGQ